MGNYITGSCLNINGANYWSVIINASEVNKRVLWAKDEYGNIIGRLLIAIDDKNRLLRFPIYYATNISLDRFFNDYLITLAKKCKLGVNGISGDVKRIYDAGWYTDGTVGVDEFLTVAQEQARRAS